MVMWLVLTAVAINTALMVALARQRRRERVNALRAPWVLYINAMAVGLPPWMDKSQVASAELLRRERCACGKCLPCRARAN
jgi:hypothetical protein